MVFVCNSGLAVEGKIFLAAFRHPQRQAEREEYRRWYEQQGWPTLGDGSQFFEVSTFPSSSSALSLLVRQRTL